MVILENGADLLGYFTLALKMLTVKKSGLPILFGQPL